MKIGFFGVGHMGAPMAINLVKAGHEVTVYDIVAANTDSVVKEGAKKAEKVADTVAGQDMVLTMLPSGRIVESLYTAEDGILTYAVNHKPLLVDCSTVESHISRKLAKLFAEKGITFLDAPVSGGVGGATAGTLSFIVGGEAEGLEIAKPVLEKMGANIFHAGASGAGQIAKACNNMLLAIHMIGSSEAINLGVNNGLDPKVLVDIMNKSSGANWSLDKYCPYPNIMPNVPSSNDFQGGFGTKLMVKDLGLASQASQSSGSTTPLGELAYNLYKMHKNQGQGDLDFSSIINLLKQEKTHDSQ